MRVTRSELASESETTRTALLSTGQAELTFPDGVVRRNVLARGATLALMVERLKRGGSAA